MPNGRARRLVMIAFPGAQGLDVLGPADVFGAVGRFTKCAGYEVVLASGAPGPLRTTSGIELVARSIARLRLRRSDTVLVGGGDEAGVRAALADRALIEFVARAARTVRRIGSVCSGAFVLAGA